MWSYYNVNRAGETKSFLVVQLAVSTVLFAFGLVLVLLILVAIFYKTRGS